MIRAEALKLRRRRGLMIWSVILTLSPVVVFYVLMVA